MGANEVAAPRARAVVAGLGGSSGGHMRRRAVDSASSTRPSRRIRSRA